MSKSKQHISQPASEHLSLEQMQAYLDDTLPSRGMHQVERHLLDCELCSDAFEGLSALPEPEQAVDAVAHIKKNIRKKTMRQPVIRRKRKLVTVLWKPMGVAAAVLILVTAIFIFLRIDDKFRKPKEQISMSASKPAAPSGQSPASSTAKNPAPAQPDQLMAQKQQVDTEREETSTASAPKADQPLSVFEAAEKKEEVAEQTSVADQINAPAPPVAAVPEPDLAEETKPALPSLAPITAANQAKKAETEPALMERAKLSTRQASGISQSAVMISGTVVSSEIKTPLPGVTITVKGTKQSAVTDEAGKFQMMVPLQSTLVFSYIGYTTGEEVVKNQEPLKVKLTEDVRALNETAVVGYGTNGNKSLEDAVFLKPQPVKGYTDFRSYLRKNLRYPEAAKQNKIEGNVRVEFWVDVDSTLSDFTIKKGLGYGCDEEAIRLIKEGPAWKPATRNKEPYKHKFSVIVPFKLKEEK